MKVIVSVLYDVAVEVADMIDAVETVVREVEDGERTLPVFVEVQSCRPDYVIKVRVGSVDHSSPFLYAPSEVPY